MGLGLGSYYGLQAFGMEPGMAGNFVQFGIFVFFCVGYISSYLFRVLNKVSQLYHEDFRFSLSPPPFDGNRAGMQ